MGRAGNLRSTRRRVVAVSLAVLTAITAPACLEFQASATDITDGPGLALFSALLASAAANANSVERTKFVYVTFRNDNNLRIFAFDNDTGGLTETGDSPVAAGPGTIGVCLHPDQTALYATERDNNSIAAFTVNRDTGALTPFGGSPYLSGADPWDCEVDPTGGNLIVAKFGTTDLVRFPLDNTGEPGGATSQMSGGNSPQSIQFVNDGAYLLASHTSSTNVTSSSFNPTTGTLTAVGGSPFAADMFMRQIAVSPDENFVYVPSRGGSTLWQYSLSAGALTALAPSNLALGGPGQAAVVSPDGLHLYVGQVTANNIGVYDRDVTTGLLTASALPPETLPAPQSLYFEPGGNYLFAASSTVTNSLSVYSRDASTGALTGISGSPFSFGDSAYQISFLTETVSQ